MTPINRMKIIINPKKIIENPSGKIQSPHKELVLFTKLSPLRARLLHKSLKHQRIYVLLELPSHEPADFDGIRPVKMRQPTLLNDLNL